MKKCSRPNFFKLTCSLKNSIACVNSQIVVLHILLRNVYNLFKYGNSFFVYLRICPLPCHPFIYFVNNPFPLCSPCFDFEQMPKVWFQHFMWWFFLNKPSKISSILFFLFNFCKEKLVANVHEKVHPFYFFIHIFIHEHMTKYSSTSPNIMS